MHTRNTLLIKNSILNYGVRLGVYFCSFLSVPLALDFLGLEKYGVFQTILTFISWAYLANLGIGNGLRNKLSEYWAVKDYNSAKEIIGVAFILAAIISSILLILGNLVLLFFFEPSWFFKNLTIPIHEVRITFIISFNFFCVQLFLALFSSIAYGIHKSYLATIVQFVHLAIYCLLLFFIIRLQIPSILRYIAFVYGIAMIIAQLCPMISIIRVKEIWPPLTTNIKKYFNELLLKSTGFFALQLSAVALFSADNFIISKLLGADEVTIYSIINKVFFIIISVYSILLIQVWNATTDANVKKDYIWIDKTIKRLLFIIIPLTFVSLVIALTFNDISEVWLNKNFHISLSIRLLFMLYTSIHCINAVYANILNGIGRLRIQTIIYILVAITNIFLSYFLIVKMEMSVAGVVLSKIICVSITASVCCYDYRRYVKKRER